MRVSITVDDIPMHASLPTHFTWNRIHRDIIRAFVSQKLPPVTGFVVGDRIAGKDQGDALESWMRASQTIGNHTFSHQTPEALGAEGYGMDIAQNESLITRLNNHARVKDRRRYFRFPYLNSGSTTEIRKHLIQVVSHLGLVVAPVTLSLADWWWNESFLKTPEKHRSQMLPVLKKIFLNWVSETMAFYRGISSMQGDHIICLHVGAFQSLVMPDLLRTIHNENFDFVSLDDAMDSRIREGGERELLEDNWKNIHLPRITQDPKLPNLPIDLIQRILQEMQIAR